MCVRMRVCLCVLVRVCARMSACDLESARECVFGYVCACVRACVRACVHACVSMLRMRECPYASDSLNKVVYITVLSLS